MRFHVLGLPYTSTSLKYFSCAFTQRIRKLCNMLHSSGHTVFHYGNDGSDPLCTEHVTIVDKDNFQKFYPYQPEKLFQWNENDEHHVNFRHNAIQEIKKRAIDKDFLLCSWGVGHKSIADAFPNLLVVEPGVGYEKIFSKYRVFDSYSWMSYLYGKNNIGDGDWYDCVIPPAFDPEEFKFNENKDNYALYVGRLIYRKGIDVAIETTKKIGIKLIIAGPGELINPQEYMCLKGSHIEHIGPVNIEQRKEILSKAKCLFVPTKYIEPFGMVVIEAGFSGTPVITTDWGAFSENVIHGKTGYRCRTLDQFAWSAKNIDNIDPKKCLKWANNFSMHKISRMYQEYFSMLYNLWDDGWYTTNKSRNQLEWLRYNYP